MAGLSEVEGKITDFELTLIYDKKNLAASSVKAVIKTESISTGITRRAFHRVEDRAPDPPPVIVPLSTSD